jgi:anti-sigma regulatory factor (Ser/Thr protein kinase)
VTWKGTATKPACWDTACRRVRHLADDAAIVVAEFAANAVLHARSGFTVTLTVKPAVVRISVRDDSPLPAAGTTGRADARAGSGRGTGLPLGG